MQNLPRARKQDDLQTIVRNLIVADSDNLLIEFDFNAIEAVLVGYFAGSADYIRLAKLGIHSFLASHVLGRPADLRWSDDDLREYFRDIKKSEDQRVIDIYNASKRTCHLSAYGGTPHKMHKSEPETFPTVKAAENLQGVYFDLCPYIKHWHRDTQLRAEKDGFLRNPFGYIHRFHHVFAYKKECGKWVKTPGPDANKVLAFDPQSTASAIIKEVMLRLYFTEKLFELAGKWLRLQVHDSLVFDALKKLIDEVVATVLEEMSRPIPELRLPASYGMGEALSIGVEYKCGGRWGNMK
jgi:hypothetical protein